ncbi:MAG: cytochrome c oxidase assembly protein [Alphaproteobacteria bacterium]|jgi:cytochrome c oxidase assembly protein subunit 11|nr:cytochrome c oxidase assembly protein [Alphaproteobacteria bacterium]|tara:strand:- start:2268 stop:2825 length:558 start_codon:yes stop_codon:yes gene_type:complete
MKKNNLKITFSLIFLVSFMFFLTFAAVPLYKLFCQVTGYGGTPKIVDIKDQIDISQKKIKIEFNSDVNKKLNWSFKPEQRSMESKIGDSILAFYKAKNNGNKSITGVATYNVLPFEAAQYFNKVDCFCFENQTLEPGEEVLLPINFYIDPKILNDPSVKHLNSIVLSYTFFQSDQNLEKISENNN